MKTLKNSLLSALFSGMVITTHWSVSQAQIIDQWNFDGANGTAIASVSNSVGSTSWAGTIADATTDGAGLFVANGDYRGSGSGTQTVSADISNITSGVVRLETVIEGYTWQGGSGALPSVFMGFQNLSGGEDIRFRFSRRSADNVTLLGQAFGTGATSTSEVDIANDILTGGLTIGLEVDIDNGTYLVDYAFGAAPATVLGSGNTATGWSGAGNLQWTLSGNMALTNNTEFDQVSLAIPEPSSVALAFGAAGFMLTIRRRRSIAA